MMTNASFYGTIDQEKPCLCEDRINSKMEELFVEFCLTIDVFLKTCNLKSNTKENFLC